jgi:hypothetical protein
VTAAGAAAPTADQIAAIQTTVQQQGLAALLASANINGWQAPVIPSAWYIEHTCPSDQKALAQAGRDFGLTVLQAIHMWAPMMFTDTNDAVYSNASTLVDLAYWLGGSEGYGNLVLAHRARDVAVTGLGRLVADVNYSLAGPQVLVGRCRASFDAPAVRARVLNVEAGALLFPTDPNVTQGSIDDVWIRAQLQAALFAQRQLPTPGSGLMDEGTRAQLEQDRAQAIALGIDVDHPNQNAAFFQDDLRTSPATTMNQWTKKWHEHFIGVGIPQNLTGVEMLLKFRQTIGDLPQRPQKRMDTTVSEGEDAFVQAWMPYLLTSAPVDIGAGAWQVYQRIQQGTFMDEDAAAVFVARARTPLPQATPFSPPTVSPTGSLPTASP